jgi:polysaccharide export outer membrane protein
MKIFFSFLFMIFLTACSGHNNQLFSKNTTQVSQHRLSIPHQVSGGYRIAPHDRLTIHFYKYPELSTSSRDYAKDDYGIEVSSNGTINLPIVKTIRVAGYTKYELEQVLRRVYSPYLKDPSVKVEILNKRVYVTGEVKNPGSLEYVRYQSITPIKAIIQRGGLTKYANPKAVKVLREVNGRYRLYNIDLTNMQSVARANIRLKPDDIVYVPHNKATDFNLPINGVEPSLSIINTILNSIVMYKAVTD